MQWCVHADQEKLHSNEASKMYVMHFIGGFIPHSPPPPPPRSGPAPCHQKTHLQYNPTQRVSSQQGLVGWCVGRAI